MLSSLVETAQILWVLSGVLEDEKSLLFILILNPGQSQDTPDILEPG